MSAKAEEPKEAPGRTLWGAAGWDPRESEGGVGGLPKALAYLPEALGFNKFKIGDWFGQIEYDRTVVPGGGKFEAPEDGGVNSLSGHKGLAEAGSGGIGITTIYNPVKYPEQSIAHHLSTRYYSPIIKTIFTDMGANIINMQSSTCADFELSALECIEYYGAKQGLVACKDWYDDYVECTHKSKQNLRLKAMYKKRHIDHHLEYLQGKRTYSETYEPAPRAHAYKEPWFDPKYGHIQQKES